MSRPTRLSESEIHDQLATVPTWTRVGDEIVRSFELADFNAAFGLLTRVALLAEKADHHPEIWNVWNKVKLTYSTHDAGGLTIKDFQAARAIDRLVSGS